MGKSGDRAISRWDRDRLEEEMLDVLAENINNLIFVAQDNRYVYVNAAFEKFSGFKASQLYGMRVWEIVTPDQQDEVRERAISRERGERETELYDIEIITSHGERKWALYQGSRILFRGKPAILGTGIDITEWKNITKELKLITAHMSDYVTRISPDGIIEYASPSHRKNTGIGLDNLIGRSVFKLVHPDDRAEIERQFYESIRQKTEPTYRLRVINDLGRYIWVETKYSLLYDERGEVVGVVASTRDIDDRKKAEDALRESELKYRRLFEMIEDLYYQTDMDGIITVLSPSVERLTGWKAEDLIGSHVGRVYVDPSDRNDLVVQLMQEGQVSNYEVVLRKFDGTVAIASANARLIVDDEGKATGVVGMLRNVTEIRRAQEQLREERKLLRTTLLSVGDGVIATDREGRVTLVNRVAAQLTGWSEQEAAGRPLEEIFVIVDEIDGQALENPVDKVLKSGQPVELANHTLLVSRDGRLRPVEDIAAPIVDEDGRIVGVVLVFRDFSEKRQKQKEIEFLSYHDQLTGLYNRRFIEEEMQRLDDTRNIPITLVMMDINGLKLTNDAFGHLVGDRLLRHASELIRGQCRSSDIVARIGGDEFLMILPHTDAMEAEGVVQRIKGVLAGETVESIPLSVAIGVATKNSREDSLEEVFREAEDCMYRSKLIETPRVRACMMEAIVGTFFTRHPQEKEHSERVSRMGVALAEALGINGEEHERIRLAGLWHDIGKIAVDKAVLTNPGKLNDVEWREIRRHPEVGFRILSVVSEVYGLAECVLSHHERWDGFGYPKGLKGEEIPLGARIIAVVDAYDAMTSDRPYRRAMSRQAAVDEIRNHAGTQFDPEIARVFVEKVLGVNW